MFDIQGHNLTALDREKIDHPNTGGLLLFSRNYDEPGQIQALIKDIRAARGGDILIAVDQEGGRIQEFQTGFTRLPPAAAYAGREDLAKTAGWLMAAELLAVEVDLSFAPVLDLDAGVSEIIGDRAFSGDAETAAALAVGFRAGMREAGMAATGKHFPGHGAVAADSHLTLPVDNRDAETIRAQDLVPYRRLIAEGLEGVMPAHVVYPCIDDLPAGFSAVWLRQILRGELGFEGAIFIDNLTMAGADIIGNYADRAKLAQQAGCDMLLVCHDPSASEQVLDSLAIRRDAEREGRLLNMRGRSDFNRRELLTSETWRQSAYRIAEFAEEYAKRN